MSETWVVDDDGAAPLPSGAAAGVLRARAAAGRPETWLASSCGRSLGFVTNGERAMVVLVDGEGDVGGQAVDPGAEGVSGGFVLSNGQHDTYPDEDTVPVGEAFRIVEHVVRTGSWPADAPAAPAG
ncbi:hypothetical protein VM98_25240 [Streptomyces rubellomurinus subsp. indigoferus]|nr:hypothetical protein VM98_25240 [Streptomyces rubellomurinus subsp. indigoferus]